MNKLIGIGFAGLAVVLGACGGGGSSSTTSASQKATTTTTTTVVPSKFLGGATTIAFPSGEKGRLTIVAQEPLPVPLPVQGASVAFVVRNNTSKAVADTKATGTVRAPTGGVAATGSDQGFHPVLVQPGGISFAYIYLEPGSSVPAGSTLTITVTSKNATGPTYASDFNVSEANLSGTQIVGTVQNPRDHEVTGPVKVDVLCVNPDGSIVSTTGSFAENADTVPANASVPFTVGLYDKPCPQFIVGASGFDMKAL